MYVQHGWGLDAMGWNEWRSAAGFAGHSQVADRGYFGTPVEAEPLPGGVVVVHSLGLHLVPESIFNGAKLVVIFGGFQTFHPAAEQQARRSRRLVQRMVDRLAREPAEVLADFYARAYAPQVCSRTVPVRLELDLLRRDLIMLNEHTFNTAWLQGAEGVLIVHGGKDQIVPVERGYALHGQVPGSVFHVFEEGGHALPFTHGAACRALITAACENGHA